MCVVLNTRVLFFKCAFFVCFFFINKQTVATYISEKVEVFRQGVKTGSYFRVFKKWYKKTNRYFYRSKSIKLRLL